MEWEGTESRAVGIRAWVHIHTHSIAISLTIPCMPAFPHFPLATTHEYYIIANQPIRRSASPKHFNANRYTHMCIKGRYAKVLTEQVFPTSTVLLLRKTFTAKA